MLRNYRRRILELGLGELLFRALTDQLIAALGVDTSKQLLDSTADRSEIRGITRLGILVEAMSKFLRGLKQTIPEQYAAVDPDDLRNYAERPGDGFFADARSSESSVDCQSRLATSTYR